MQKISGWIKSISNSDYSKQKDVEAGKKKESRSLKAGWKTIKLLLPYFWPKGELGLRIRLIVCFLLIIVAKVLDAVVPQTYKYAIDSLPDTYPVNWLLLYSVLRVVSGILGDIRSSIFINVSQYATKSIASQTFSHLQYLSLRFHLTRKTGAIMRTIDRGTSSVTSLTSLLAFNIFPMLLQLIIVCGVLGFAYGGWLAIITFGTIAAYVAFTLTITEWRTKFRRNQNELDNDTGDRAVDSLINYETVKYFTSEDHEVERYANKMNSYFKAALKTNWSLTLLNSGQTLIITAGMAVALLVTAKKVSKGEMSIGDLVAVQLYITQLYSPLSWLGTAYRAINQSFIDMEKMFEILDEPFDIDDKPGSQPLNLPKNDGADVEFRNVSFSYDTKSEDPKQILKNISFTIPGGETVVFANAILNKAIVGDSGAGKSTISRLLCRLYDVTGGSVTVNNQDIRDVTQKSLRGAIGVVPQDTNMFNDTIEYNIQYGRRDGEGLSTIEAAKEAHIHDFIQTQDEKYGTVVGERGLRLSGGEKQRVAIARTIMKDPPILILDEATSALDSTTEKDIQHSLLQVSRGRTTLIIGKKLNNEQSFESFYLETNQSKSLIVTHRLSTIVHSDQILVLRNGEIIERGNHNDLYSQKGEYYKMWNQQTEQEEQQKEILIDI